jgi:hypothetical protein
MAEKFKMASETYIFVILPSKRYFSSDFKTSTAFEASFYYLNFKENTGFFEYDVIFEKKLLFSKMVLLTLNLTFFKFSKSNIVYIDSRCTKKKLPKKIFQDGGYFQNGVCTFYLPHME